jgi:hypothetical protein
MDKFGKDPWTFETHFERNDITPCPLASQTLLYVQNSPSNDIKWVPEPNRKENNYLVYELKEQNEPFQIKALPEKNNPSKENNKKKAEGEYYDLRRYLVGYGQA